MKQITINGWRRVQRRTAERLYLAGYKMAVSVPDGMEHLLHEGISTRTRNSFNSLEFALYSALGPKCPAVWYWVECTATLPARPANHAPAEKSALAARINQAFKHAGHEAPIDYGRLQHIPRRLLRACWAEIRETEANELIQQAANSVIM